MNCLLTNFLLINLQKGYHFYCTHISISQILFISFDKTPAKTVNHYQLSVIEGTINFLLKLIFHFSEILSGLLLHSWPNVHFIYGF